MNRDKKILIVEDEFIIAGDIERTLKRLGYIVSDIVSTGEAALQSVTQNKPDLVLMDMKLKGEMDGIQTAHRLHADFKTPVVYLSAYSNDALLQRAQLSEPYGYIVKPFTERSLFTTIEVAINKSRLDLNRAEALTYKEKIYDEIAQSEQKLQETAQTLLRSNKKLEQFTSTAAHDLKSPLGNIMLYSEALAEKFSNLGEEGESYIRVIRKSAARMEKLINDLLEFARISYVPKAFQEIDLKNMISLICNDLEVMIKEKNALIEIGELPRLKGTPSQLQHVFQNLIENALKYSRTNDSQPLIMIDGKVEGDFVEIHVKDKGIGFDEQYATEIFLPFKRLTNNQEGTGIGLAICHKIIENHGGTITAKSHINEGSDFIVKLPL